MVHHDFALGRLTLGSRQLAAMTAAGLKEVPFKDTADRMMTLGELCDFVAGRTPLVIELKSRFDGDLPAGRAHRAGAADLCGSGRRDVVRSGPRAGAARDRARPAARHRGGAPLRGSGMAGADAAPAAQPRASCCTHFRTRPHFVAYQVKDLPSPGPLIARHIFGLPLLTWTVRSEEDRHRARTLGGPDDFRGVQAVAHDPEKWVPVFG